MKFGLRIRQYIKMVVQNAFLPVCYRYYTLRYGSGQKGALKSKREANKQGLIVFADAHHDTRPENMELLYQYLIKNTDPGRIYEWYLDYQRSSFGQVYRHMTTFMKLYAQADCVVICDNFLPVASCKKNPRTKVVQLWHACGAFKKFGYDTEDDIPANYKGNVFANIDLVTVSAPGCCEPFASAMRLPLQNVRPLGVSRTDVYYDEQWRRDCILEFYQQYPDAKEKKVVLWAPTFRGNPADPGNIELDIQALEKELGEEYLVLTRVHPHMMKKYGKDNCPIVTERLFPVVDVLIADYSSLIYEYLLFGHPMILYVPDLEEYRAARGFYLDFDELPGTIVMKEGELAAAIRRETERDGGLPVTGHTAAEKGGKTVAGNPSENVPGYPDRNPDEKRESFIRRYMSGCDGGATARIADYMIGTS